MTKLELTKTIINVVVGTGATRIVTQVIKYNTNPQTITDKVTMLAGALVLGQMAADSSKTYTGDKIDELADWWKTNVTVTKN